MPIFTLTRIVSISLRHFVACVTLIIFTTPNVYSETWPSWRGLVGDNHAAVENQVPEKWDMATGKNVIWKTAIPGRGHSSPVVTDDAIFLTTADRDQETQALIKLDRKTGRLVGETVLHRNGLPERIHSNNSYASPTPAFDGQHLFICFDTDDSIVLSKTTPDGQIVWQKKVCRFKPDQFQFGYGASPVVEGEVVIVAAEYDGDESGLYGLDRETGKQVWKAPRPINLNFASPIVANVGGTRQLFLAGASTINSYDPVNGKLLWSIDESTDAICGTVVWNDRNIFVSGGNPGRGTWCVRGDGTKIRVWDNRVKCYEQSLLVFGDHLLALDDYGVAHCFDANNGDKAWQKRLFKGAVSASPLLVGDRIYTASEDGNVVVISTNTQRCEVLAENQTGNSMFASPVAVDDRLYLRTGVGYGRDRQEYLLAIGATGN